MNNDRHDHEFSDYQDEGPRRGRDRRHGRRSPGDNPFDNLFGPQGPFGKSGPFGPGGLFGPEGADLARSFWEAAKRGQAEAGFDRSHPIWGGEYAFDRSHPIWGGEYAAEPPTERGRRGPRGERGPRGDRTEWVGRGDRPERAGRPEREGRAERGERGGRDERHRHGPHRGHFAGRRGGRRPRGDVRLAALLLIAEEPRNGYQLIEELAGRTGGSWRPSSGAIYPALAQLEDEGLIAPNEVDGRKVYELTDAGRDAVAAHQGPAPWDTATQDASDALGGRPGGQMWQAFGQVAMATKAVGATRNAATFAEATKVLDETRRALYRILADGPQDAPAPTYDDAVDAEFVEDDLSD